MADEQTQHGRHRQQPKIYYLDGSNLKRPVTLPKKYYALGALFVIVAIIVGCICGYQFVHNVVNSQTNTKAAVEAYAKTSTKATPPLLNTLLFADDETILTRMNEEQGNIINLATLPNQVSSTKASLELIKVPADLDFTRAQEIYTNGFNTANDLEKIILLKSSWDLTTERDTSTSVRVRYADFSSGSLEGAISNAIATQGFSNAVPSESGTDETGNTYSTGTSEIDGVVYTWRVSAIKLSSVYDINGAPDSAVYIGIRLTL